MRMSQPHRVQGFLLVHTGANQHMHKSAVDIHWLQTAKVESNNTGQAPLKHLHSPIDCGTYTQNVHSVCRKLGYPLQLVLTHHTSYPGNAAACSGANTSIHKQTAPPSP